MDLQKYEAFVIFVECKTWQLHGICI